MGFTKASGHLRKKRNQLSMTFPKVNNNITLFVEYHFRIYRINRDGGSQEAGGTVLPNGVKGAV